MITVAEESGDFSQWEQEMGDGDTLNRLDEQLDNVGDRARHDDEVAAVNEELQHERAFERSLRRGDAREQQEASEMAARQKLAAVHDAMPAQLAALEAQERQEKPEELLANEALVHLRANVAAGEVGNPQLTEGQTPGKTHEQAIQLLFTKLGLPDPIAELNDSQSRLQRLRHTRGSITHGVELDGQSAEVFVSRYWSRPEKRYRYFIGGGAPTKK